MPAEKDAPDTGLANLTAFAAALRLDAVETGLFRFVFHCDRDGKLRSLCRQLVETRQMDSSGIIAAAAGLLRSEVDARLRAGPLRSLGLIDGGGDGATQFFHTVSYRIWQALLPPSNGIADVERALIGAPAFGALTWNYFAHVSTERDFVARLLEGAVSKETKGVNILLYGPPGTGKTELCKMIALHVGARLFAIGEQDEDGGEPSRYDRLNALRLADRLTARCGKSLLLFDEMEDILQHGERMFDGRRWQRRSGSKVFFNRLLEENATPVLWTANSLWEFDSAFLRRMTFVFEMKSPSMKTRLRLWQGAATRHGLELASDTADSLARRHKSRAQLHPQCGSGGIAGWRQSRRTGVCRHVPAQALLRPTAHARAAGCRPVRRRPIQRRCGSGGAGNGAVAQRRSARRLALPLRAARHGQDRLRPPAGGEDGARSAGQTRI